MKNLNLKSAVKILQDGGVIIHPTETVYGITCRWDNPDALTRVSQIKGRDNKKPYSILVDRIDQLFDISGWSDMLLSQFLDEIFPAPLTLIIPRQKDTGYFYWDQLDRLGFRIPDHQLSRQLVNECGTALITTSANLSAKPPVSKSENIDKEILNLVDGVIVDNADTKKTGLPSTVIDLDWPQKSYSVFASGADKKT